MRKMSFLALPLIMMFGLQTNAKPAFELNDPNYQFDQTKLDAANDAFHFLRTYVDYFYLVIKENSTNLPTVESLENVAGWCVGDAHPENFGMLIQQNGRSLFTMNDIDDSGPCPVGLDLVRLMVSSSLAYSDINIDSILQAYLTGLQRKTYDTPSVVDDMSKKSQKKGTDVDSKKIDGKKIVRDENAEEVTPEERDAVKAALIVFQSVLSSKTKVLDMISTRKTGGGSGGLLRYEVLLDNDGTLLHLELKEEVTPSIYPVATSDIPPSANRILTTLKLDQDKPSQYYAVVKVNDRDMFVRPRFDGNVGVNLTKQSDGDNKDLIYFEAYTLGLIHSRSVQDIPGWVQQLQYTSIDSLKNNVSAIAEHFQAKFSSLKK